MTLRLTSAIAIGASLGILVTGCSSSPEATGSSSSCTPAHDFKTAKPGVLTVGVISSSPYSILNPVDQKWTGIDAEWAKAIAKKECLTVKASAVPGQDAIQKVKDGTIDLLSAGAFITPERGKVVGQTQPLYYQYSVIVATSKISHVKKLRGKTVGVEAGALYVNPLKKIVGSGSIKQYPTTDEILSDLKAGRVDAAVTASGEAFYKLRLDKYAGLKATRIQEGPSAGSLGKIYGVNMPFNKSNKAFKKALNDDIAVLRKDGTAKKILAHWNQDDNTTLNGS